MSKSGVSTSEVSTGVPASAVSRSGAPASGGSLSGVSLLEVPAEKTEKRLNLILSAGVYSDLSKMARERRTTMTEVVRLALGLIKVAIAEIKQGHKLVVVREDGEVLKELVLPG